MATLPTPVVAQGPLFLVTPSTQVASLEFVFENGETFERDFLMSRIALTERGALAGLRDRLSFLPLISGAGEHFFDPVELQKDVIRLSRLYGESGFLDHDVRYEVTLDTTSNTVDVRFVIQEGRPIALDRLLTETMDDGEVVSVLAEALSADWRGFEDNLRRDNLGRRSGPAQLRALRGRAESWLRDRGYPRASVNAERFVDSAAARAVVTLRVDPGPRRRVGSFAVEGNQEISDHVLRREFDIEPDDWYSASRVAAGERAIYSLDMIRWADASIANPDAPSEEPLSVMLQIEEGPPRLVSGQVGYATSAGITGQASWSHRNFLGGARVLTFAAEARTGILATDQTFERRYGLSATLREPYLGGPNLSGLLTPFFEYRDGSIDESIRNGLDATAVYEFGGVNTASLQYSISVREVLQYRFGTLSAPGIDFLTLQTLLDDSLGAAIRESRLTASGTWGRLDDRVRPREGFLVRLALQGAGPSTLSEVEFGKITGSLTGFQPLGGDVHARVRLSGGRVFPFGNSVPETPDAGIIRFLELRDALLTAGGTGDVQGWPDGLLGPKTPDVRLVEVDDSLVVQSDRFIPIGGFARIGFSTELAVRLPGGANRHAAFIFLDGARVATSDSRYGVTDPFDEERFFFGTGAGLEFATPVGPLRVALGYKLNPSALDLLSPMQVQRAAEEGVPLSSLPREWIRRFQIHIDLGGTF